MTVRTEFPEGAGARAVAERRNGSGVTRRSALGGVAATLSLAPVAALGQGTPAPRSARPAPKPAASPPPPPPVLERDITLLPERVFETVTRILDAARTGDAERLRVALERNETPTVLARGRRGDPVALLKDISADGEGRELLALLVTLLDGGYAVTGKGTPAETYVWPGFSQAKPETIGPEEWVDAYRLLRHPEVVAWRGGGRYPSHTLGIGPDGTWHWFFRAPDEGATAPAPAPTPTPATAPSAPPSAPPPPR